MLDISGHTAMVTGATSGIGYSILRCLVSEGTNVVAVARSPDRLQALHREFGSRVLGIRADVLVEDDIAEVVGIAVKSFGSLNMAFNVVGSAGRAKAIVDTEKNAWDGVMNTSLRSVFFGVKHQARAMIASGDGGAIVNISSINQIMPVYGSAGYTAAKAGVGMLTKNAALELARYQIRVNAVLPGVTDTRPNQRSKVPEIRDAFLERIPLGHIASSDEIARPAIFLASPDARYITGVSLVVDGGWALTGYPDASRWI
jgi:NAD(P)-dependent dehydrogenase (short-subunit alcohol dehydrogenase family)